MRALATAVPASSVGGVALSRLDDLAPTVTIATAGSSSAASVAVSPVGTIVPIDVVQLSVTGAPSGSAACAASAIGAAASSIGPAASIVTVGGALTVIDTVATREAMTPSFTMNVNESAPA